jgi:hypothetical protein
MRSRWRPSTLAKREEEIVRGRIRQIGELPDALILLGIPTNPELAVHLLDERGRRKSLVLGLSQQALGR